MVFNEMQVNQSLTTSISSVAMDRPVSCKYFRAKVEIIKAMKNQVRRSHIQAKPLRCESPVYITSLSLPPSQLMQCSLLSSLSRTHVHLGPVTFSSPLRYPFSASPSPRLHFSLTRRILLTRTVHHPDGYSRILSSFPPFLNVETVQ